ncbi:hypothetical protein IMF27_15855 [Pseudomonas sp. PCH199]|uniref:hypothetical protein n=1 Tax=unclassified Pseudomonas TaxID=196821 RepID=UPI000FFCC1CD|nr:MULTISPECIES: hypothetical protein [unclassified Pseudomonas]MCW8276970.1 hypothetical protein [Pseudomonas sp. PCH199]
MSTLQYLTIALSIWASASDIHRKSQGAWQGIFSGRALARIRKTRTMVFDVVSQAPFVGWVLNLGDKAALKLHEAFFPAKTWTISHYIICATVAIGLFASTRIAVDIANNRVQFFWALIPLSTDDQTNNLLHVSISELLAIMLYSSAIFTVGTIRGLHYLKYLSTIFVGFTLAALWFTALNSKANPTSGWYYPLAFFCFMAITRTVSSDSKKQAKIP